MRFGIGVHPHAAGKYARDPAGAAAAVATAMDAQPLTRGLGEIGLDYHYDFAPRDVQQQVFREQIQLAARRRLPIIIHTREADDDTFAILAEELSKDVGGVFHCFTGDRVMARRALDIGFHISLAGIVRLSEGARAERGGPDGPNGSRLLIETDSPFLAPVPLRGKRNEPAYVARVAEVIGELRGMPAEAIGEATQHNFNRLFNP